MGYEESEIERLKDQEEIIAVSFVFFYVDGYCIVYILSSNSLPCLFLLVCCSS